MSRWSFKRKLWTAWSTTGGLFAFWLSWTLIGEYRVYKSAPPGWTVEYFTPDWINALGYIGFFGLIFISLISLRLLIMKWCRSN